MWSTTWHLSTPCSSVRSQRAWASFAHASTDLFPRILDTKLLLSQTVDPDVVGPSLQDLYLELQVQAYPFVKTAAPGWGFTRYSCISA